LPFAVLIRFAVDRRLVDAGRDPPAVCPPRRPRVILLARFDRYVGPPGRGGFGFWVRFRGPDVPRVPPVPPRLLRTGPDAPRWRWTAMGFCRLSRVFVRRPAAPPLLEAANARGLRRVIAARLQIASRQLRLPFGVSKGPATNQSGGVSAGPMSPSEVFAPSAELRIESRASRCLF
jgi:hypothetical protein